MQRLYIYNTEIFSKPSFFIESPCISSDLHLHILSATNISISINHIIYFSFLRRSNAKQLSTLWTISDLLPNLVSDEKAGSTHDYSQSQNMCYTISLVLVLVLFMVINLDYDI